MRRWLKILLAILAGIVVLLVLNALAVSNETRDAERNIEGAELVDTSSGTIQVLDEGDLSGSPIVLLHGYAGSVSLSSAIVFAASSTASTATTAIRIFQARLNR